MAGIDNLQVLTAYEQCNMSPEDISLDLGYALEAVKLCLLQNSKKYKALVTTKDGDFANRELFDENDVALAKRTMKELCIASEVDSVRFKAAEFIINEKMGRNDVKALQATGVSISQFNDMMQKARSAMEAAKRKARVIDVSNVVPKAIAA